MTNRGLFITFEGIDGCGKSTQLELVDKYLKEKNHKTITTLEPGGTKIGKSLRQILLHHDGFVAKNCELFLYLADRSQQTEEIILKNVNEGITVLSDRHTDSTIAYQGYARGGDIEELEQLNKIATKAFCPDLTFLFDIDVEIAQTRVGKEKDRLESESLEFHKKVRNGYLELAKKYPNRIKVINSNMSIESVFGQVKKYIDEIL